MKTMKWLGALAMMVCALSITSCGNDDGGSSNNGGNTNSNNNGGSNNVNDNGGGNTSGLFQGPQRVFGNHRIKKIKEYSSLDDQVADVFEFTYNTSGFVSEIKVYDNEVFVGSTRISYDNGLSAVSYDKNGNSKGRVEFPLGANGFVSYYQIIDDKGHNEYAKFTYNNDGQLQTLTWGEEGETTPSDDVWTLTYSDGDITKCTSGDGTTEYFYSTANQNPIDNVTGFMEFDKAMDIDMDDVWVLYLCGGMGKGTKHLPLTAITKDGNDTETITNEWILDNQNRPVKLISTSSHSLYGSTSARYYTIEW